MATRSMTRVYDDRDNLLVAMYRHWDGYPTYWGKLLGEFIASRRMVNGIGDDKDVFNGAYCLAASLVAQFKEGPGGIYLYPHKWADDDAEEFNYIVRAQGDNTVTIQVLDWEGRALCDPMPATAFVEFAASWEDQ